METINIQESSHASVIRGAGISENTLVHGKFIVECYDKDGNLKWTDTALNLVTDEGKKHLLDNTFGGTAQITSWYVGLKKTTAGGAAADTLASHAGWTEAIPGTDYSGNRKGPITWSAASGTGTVSITHGSAASFTSSGTWTAYGCILCSAATGTSGKLYSVSADFGTPKALTSSDILNVTYTTQV
jgi:hypothetical protein